MKVAVFFDGYSPLHETKDPGLITIGLGRLGDIATLVTETKSELDGYEAPFPMVVAEKNTFKDINFWRRINADVIICYTWLDSAYNSVVAAIRQSGKKVYVKADSDGRLGYPVVPRYQHQHVMSVLPLRLWYGFSRLEGRIGKIEGRIWKIGKIEQIEMLGGILIESPGAFENIRRFLSYWNRSDLLSKFHVVPNPVADDISEGEMGPRKDIMMSIGRWSASIQKNTRTMLKCSKTFLNDNPEWRLRLVATLGWGRPEVEKAVSKWNNGFRRRIEILGPLNNHDSVAQLLGESRIFFMPSNWEGMPIAAAEAVCMGCTVVGTPLEPLDFLVAGGFSGTLAKDFAFQSLIQALAFDASKHKQGTYDPIEIAGYWRPRLSIREVASQIHKLTIA